MYHPYGPVKNATERATITAFWDEALRTALAQFQADPVTDTLDAVMASSPAWTDRHHERWSSARLARAVALEVIQRLTDYLAGLGGVR